MSTRSQTTSVPAVHRPMSGLRTIRHSGGHGFSRADNPFGLVIPSGLQPATNLPFGLLSNPAMLRYVQLLASSVLCLAGLVLLRYANPATSRLFPPCPFLWLTGWYCPGCGSLRALHQLLHGNVRAAFAFNPFAVLAFPFLTYGGASRAAYLLNCRHFPSIFLPAWSIWTLFSAIVLFGILRNLPLYPFHLLAPGAMLVQ
jgi:hypothetical protein